jgi:hypothetical protein
VSFSLTKWYLDLVTDDGGVAIAYWAEVRWKGLRQPLCGSAALWAPALAWPTPTALLAISTFAVLAYMSPTGWISRS